VEKKSQNSIWLNDFLICFENQEVEFIFAILLLNNAENPGNWHLKNSHWLNKCGDWDKKGAGEKSLLPFGLLFMGRRGRGQRLCLWILGSQYHRSHLCQGDFRLKIHNPLSQVRY